MLAVTLRLACVGGGPGGLFLAALLKSADPSAEVVLFERNRRDDTFGFGVVFSSATLGGLDRADPVLLEELRRSSAHWDRIEVRVRGERFACEGNGMAAITRATLLRLLHERAVETGVELRFQTEVQDLALLDDFDVVVAGDGANSWYRQQFADHFGTTTDVASAKFIWLGTTYPFDGLTFVHARNDDGVFAVHGYPIGGAGTFIVETDEESWRRAGLDRFDVTQPPGPSDLGSKRYLEELFADQLGGHELLVNNSRWANFRTIHNATWSHENLVLIGDAAHTAHFSVGSGTKMAMEDAVSLAGALSRHRRDVTAAFEEYEANRRPSVEKIQRSARPSLSWWEHFGLYHDTLEPPQFAFHFFSRAIGRERLAERDPEFVRQIEEWWLERHGADVLSSPLDIGPVTFPRRLVSIDSAGESLRCGGLEVPLLRDWAGPARAPWAAWLDAPDDDRDLASAIAQAKRAIGESANLVAIGGGTALARARLSEEVRLQLGVPSAIVDDELTGDAAVTTVLAGRADLVGSRGGAGA